MSSGITSYLPVPVEVRLERLRGHSSDARLTLCGRVFSPALDMPPSGQLPFEMSVGELCPK